MAPQIFLHAQLQPRAEHRGIHPYIALQLHVLVLFEHLLLAVVRELCECLGVENAVLVDILHPEHGFLDGR